MDPEISNDIIEACEKLDAVLSEVENQHGREMLDHLGWQLLRAEGETNAIALIRMVGSHIVQQRTNNWQVQNND